MGGFSTDYSGDSTYTPTDFSDPTANLFNATFGGGATYGDFSLTALAAPSPTDNAGLTDQQIIAELQGPAAGPNVSVDPVFGQAPTDLSQAILSGPPLPVTLSGPATQSNPSQAGTSPYQVLGLAGQLAAVGSQAAVAATGRPSTLSNILGSLGLNTQRLAAGQPIGAAMTTQQVLLWAVLGILVLILFLKFFTARLG